MSGIPNIDGRWENGIPHRGQAVKLFMQITNVDYDNHDYFKWRLGGDGDNGEELMFILDILYDRGWRFIPPGKDKNE